MENNEDPRQMRLLSILTVLTYLLALTFIASCLSGHPGFPLDDSWIHQSVARNFARFGSLGYLPHQRSSGSTSLLWTLLLSGNYALLPSLSPVVFTLAINVVCTCATGVLLLRLALRDGFPTPIALIVSVAPAFDGNYMWLAFTGMEHLLFITLSFASVWFWLAPSRETNATGSLSSWAAGACMGLLSMTRPEGVALPALLLGASWLGVPRRTHTNAQLIVASVACGVLACIPFAINLYTSHSLLPVTFQGRKWLLFSDAGSRVTVLGRLLEAWSARPLKAVMAFDGVVLSRPAQIAMFAALGIIALLIFAGVRSLVRERRQLLLVMCGWSALHTLLYVLILPATGHGGRYQPLLLLFMLPLVALGVADLWRRSRLAITLAPAAVVLTVGFFSLPLWRAALAGGIDHINRTHGAVSAWLDRNLPDQKIAVFDIGRIGYDRGATGDPAMIDLGGLTDTAYITYLYNRTAPTYLAQHNIHYIVLPLEMDGQSGIGDALRLLNNPAVSLHHLFRACSPTVDWQLPWSEFRNAFQCQEVDAVSFTGSDSVRR